MNRREFLRRSAPLVAASLVTPLLVEQLAFRLFGPKKYLDFGACGIVYLDGVSVMRDVSVDLDEFSINTEARVSTALRPEYYGVIDLSD